jgi:hypothetical protein
MRTVVLAVFVAVLAATLAHAGSMPSELTYSFYIQGVYAGKDVIKVTEKANTYVFESRSNLTYEEFTQKMEFETIVDKKTFALVSCQYKGNKMGLEIEGNIAVDGKTVVGTLVENGAEFPSRKSIGAFLILFQNYIASHQVILVNAIAAAEGPALQFEMFYPSDFAKNGSIGGAESEIELPTQPRGTVCTKYAITSQGSTPFYGYYDPERRVPIYLDFPQTNTEVFLQSAFGENPRTRYVRASGSP